MGRPGHPRIRIRPARRTAADFRHLYPLLGDFLLKVNESQSVEVAAELAAHHVRMVTGFGRVMVYQFDRDGHGHVMAESKEDSYHSYMGQRFPASDIPAQARDLYALSRIRLIQDANYARRRWCRRESGDRAAQRPVVCRPAQRLAGAPAIHAQHGHAGLDVGLADGQGQAVGPDFLP
jgi:GAF domain-containing protein